MPPYWDALETRFRYAENSWQKYVRKNWMSLISPSKSHRSHRPVQYVEKDRIPSVHSALFA